MNKYNVMDIKKLENQDKIHILGGKKDVQRYYFSSDVFATCTLHENHSLSIIEACAAQIPSIVTDTGGNTESVVDGISGWVIPIADSVAIEQIIRKVSGQIGNYKTQKDQEINRRINRESERRT